MLKRTLGLCTALLLLAAAAQAGPLENELTAFRVAVDADGREQLTPTETAAPGETIEYHLLYRNTGTGELTGLTVDGPIPANTVYLKGSAATRVAHDFRVSVDGGKTWEAEPVRRVRRRADGTEETVILGPEAYTHLRWIAREPLAPEARQEYRYRVRIE